MLLLGVGGCGGHDMFALPPCPSTPARIHFILILIESRFGNVGACKLGLSPTDYSMCSGGLCVASQYPSDMNLFDRHVEPF